jgi:hypothetical protein
MTEQEWLASTDEKAMLTFLRGKASDRKFRLFACACCRSIWDLFEEDSSRDAVKLAERYADGKATTAACRRAAALADDSADDIPSSRVARNAADPDNSGEENAFHCAIDTAEEAAEVRGDFGECEAAAAGSDSFQGLRRAYLAERAAQLALLRDCFGNPFRRQALSLTVLTATVRSLALKAYQQRRLPSGHFDPARLAVLADALEDAGCADADILAHLRSPGPHVRGCWALDLLVDKG